MVIGCSMPLDRLVRLVKSATVLAGLACCSVVTHAAGNIPETSICFDNDTNYGDPHVYYWNAAPAGALADTQWPGEAMTAQDGYDCYDPGAAVDALNVIFNNNGAPQTADLIMPQGNTCYQNNNWTTLQACGFNLDPIAPTANAGADITATIGQTVALDASASSDPDGSIVSYVWSDGLTGVAPTVSYAAPGTYTLILTVTDDAGLTGTDELVVTVNDPSDNTVLYFRNDLGYAQPNAYLFGLDPVMPIPGEWPGPVLNSLGDNWYSYDFGTIVNTAQVVFNDNGNPQTADLNFSADTPCYQNQTWVSIADCEYQDGQVNPPDYNYPAGKAVFYFNNNNWQPPTAYVWEAQPVGSTADMAWPGVAMTEFGDDLWFVDIGENTVSGNVIFSNNGNNQTADLAFSGDDLCFKNDVWMTLAACGIPMQVSAEAGPNRIANQNSRIALSAEASVGDVSGATWESAAWTGVLNGAHVVTPELGTVGTFTVTLTLASGGTDTFELYVVSPTAGLPERPLLAKPLAFPTTGSVSSGNYEFDRAFANLTGAFKSPVMVTPDPATNLMYVVDKQGILAVFPYDVNVQQNQVITLLDIRDEVRDFNEQGLLSMLFDPNFIQNRYVYIYYIEGENDDEASGGRFDDGVLQRITLNSATNPTGIEAGSRVEILRIPQVGPDHKGSKMDFHPQSGLFYMGIGDGGYGDTAIVPTEPDTRTNNSSQEGDNLRGKFIRIELLAQPENGKYYRIPADNPFVNDPNIMDEIWTMGHRNPWRWAFDTEAPYTLWAAEVGQQGPNAFEEVNIIEGGKNYGWPICEGTFHRGFNGGDPDVTRQCTGDLEGPVSGYEHIGNDPTSIIGGFVYRGSKFPDLYGAFLFGDYDTKRIWGVRQGETLFDVGTLADNISGFSTDPSGEEVYIQTHTYDKNQGLAADIFILQDNGAQAAVIPEMLSETGLFADLSTQFPASGVIEYAVNVDAWFDEAKTRHFVSIPNNEQITFKDIERWDLPVGSVLVKHVDLPTSATTTAPFETSVLFHQVNGWAAVNYKWNADGSDAVRVDTAESVTVQQFIDGQLIDVTRSVRDATGCASCHVGSNSADPRGVHTRQMNGEFDYQGVSDNQLDVLASIDLFASAISASSSYQSYPDVEDNAADINTRARAYLDTNCESCHGGGFMDMSFDTAVGEMDIMNVDKGNGNYRMLPFNHSVSLMYSFQADGASNLMPKGTTLTNATAEMLMREWIDAAGATQTGVAVNIVNEPDDIKVGTDVQLETVATYNNGFEVSPTGVVDWSSNANTVVTVAGTGATATASAVGEGTAVISAVSGGQVGTVSLTVTGGAAQPSNFQASALSSSVISLNWSDESNDETQFLLSRATSSNGPFQQIADLAPNTESYSDTGLSPSSRYYYQLVAVSNDGPSIAVTTFADTPEPSGIDSLRIETGAPLTLIGGETRQIVAIATVGDDEWSATLSADWSSSDPEIVSVSTSGNVTGGQNAGIATITASFEGLTATTTIQNRGPGSYIYFNNEAANWDPLTVHLFSTSGGVQTDHTVWPGDPMELSVEFGGKWYRYAILDSTKGSDFTEVVINCGGQGCQTEDIPINFNTPWINGEDGIVLNQAPQGGGAVNVGTQIVVGKGEVTWANNGANLTGTLITPGALVDLTADNPGTGQNFVRWEGTGAPYLLDPNNANTKMLVPETLSLTLNAVFETIEDEFEVGRDYYRSPELGCVGCHGVDGTTGTSLVNVPNNYNLASLTAYIAANMPQGNPGACTGECAESIAEMILADAYDEPAGVCQADSLEFMIPQDRSFRLLTVEEYNNSVRDLLGFTSDVDVTTGRLPPDIPVNGFKTGAETIFTDDYAQGYVTAAEAVADLAGDSLLSFGTSCASGDINCLVNSIGKKVFRRPLTAEEVTTFTQLHAAEGDRGLIVGLFSAPAMLYRSEAGELITSGEDSGYYRLSDYEVASMLSYTYWATTPDDSLMAAADAGQLSAPSDIRTKLVEMMADPRAEEAFERFVYGWLDIEKEIGTNELSDSLKEDMKEETIRFVKTLVFSGGSLEELITADYSYMTQQLAEHYDLPWPGGTGWQRVDYSGANSERRGVMGHASILALQSAQEKTHPVKRGLFVRRNLMCQDFPPPPLGAALDPETDPTQGVRYRYEVAHAQPGCDACHQFIDGIGFGFESYNNIGKFVTTETTDDGTVLNIDASGYIGSLNSAETFLSEQEPVVNYLGLDELADLVAGSSNSKACFARQWFRYSRGKHETPDDSCTLQVFGKTFKETPNASMLDLMIEYTQTKNYTLRK